LFLQAHYDHAPDKYVSKDPNKLGKLLPLVSDSNTSKSNKQARDSNGFERTTVHIIAGKTQRIRRTKSLTTSSLGIGHVFICISGKTHDNNKKYIQA